MLVTESILGVHANKKPKSGDDLFVKADGDIDIADPECDIPMEQALPTEIIRFILDILVVNEQSGALANAAQCNRRMYDYVVPRLYKKIRVNKENREKLFFGCTPTDGSSSGRSRKDIAMRYCRKLILDNCLTWDLARFYEDHQVVEEVDVTPQCLLADKRRSNCPDICEFLSKLAPASKDGTPLRVTCHVLKGQAHRNLFRLIRHNRLNSYDLITYELYNTSINHQHWDFLGNAYLLRAVVHFVHHTTASPDEAATLIGRQLFPCFQAHGRAAQRGQLYLCGIPQLVMSPDELAIAIDVEETALLKLYNSLNQSRPHPVTSWKTFQSKIKLVKSGFRPSMTDLIEGHRLDASNAVTV